MPLPTVILPGFFAGASDYYPLEKDLNQRGIPTVVVPLRKRDWFPTIGGRSMVPILQQLNMTIQQVLQKYSVPQINLIGHSAGGWIARIYMGEKPYTVHGDVIEAVKGLWNMNSVVNTLITLGTPHISQERWTKKNLDFVKDNYPGAFYSQVRYVCIAGKAVYGARTFKTWLPYNSYQLTIGQGETWGDGITPVEAAHLKGAENLTLDGVWHSPRSPGKWYGSPDVVANWLKYLA
ncbi:MAG: alpha/beta hydrolase [Cyanobacteriota bacterium]|nr:alpha/beta hydrolase [Cyanobacteriota bacterium]